MLKIKKKKKVLTGMTSNYDEIYSTRYKNKVYKCGCV